MKILRVFSALLILVALLIFIRGICCWFGVISAGYDPPIPVSVPMVLASYTCRVPIEFRYHEQTRVRLDNIEADLTRIVTDPGDHIWKYAPVKGTDDKLYLQIWRDDVPPAGPTTVIGYQLNAPSGSLPPALAAQSERNQLYMVSYDNRSYYQFQHQEAVPYFLLAAIVLILAALSWITAPAIRYLQRRRQARAAKTAALLQEPTSPAETVAAAARHQRLLDTLRDCGAQSAPKSRVLQVIGSALMVFGLAIVTLIGRNITDATIGQTADVPLRVLIAVSWMALAVVVLARVRNRFLRTAWQAMARSAESELTRAGSRRPILYLRSFQLDDKVNRAGWIERLVGTMPLQTAEQKVTQVLRKLGPVIAIGRPGEQLPPLGAARFYVGHDRWKAKVADIARESRFVLWASGVTEGLTWEISHLVENLPPENVILWAHPHLLRLGAREREAEWARFRNLLGGHFPKPLPETLGEARFFFFYSDWQPQPVAPPRRPWTWFGSDAPALRALLAAKLGTRPEADVVYPGPKMGDDFAGLIGASGKRIDWARCAAFLIAGIVAQLPLLVPDASYFFIEGLPKAVLLAAGAIAAYRYLPGAFAPAAAAILPAMYASLLRNHGIDFGYYGLLARVGSFLPLFATYLAWVAGLNWATRRIRPLVVALWIGAMCGLLTSELIAYFSSGRLWWWEEGDLFWLLLRPTFFAVSLAIAIRFVPSPKDPPAPS